MQIHVSPCSLLQGQPICFFKSWFFPPCSLCSGLFRAAPLPLQPGLLSTFSGHGSSPPPAKTVICLRWCSFPLQHHTAIPRSRVSRELYNFNTNVCRVAVHLKEQCWAGFGRFAGSKLGWVWISAWIINPSQKRYLKLGCQSRFCWILIFPVTYTSHPCPVMVSSALWNDTTFLSLASCGSVNMLNLSSHSRVFSALQQSVGNFVTPHGLIFQHPARVKKLAL